MPVSYDQSMSPPSNFIGFPFVGQQGTAPGTTALQVQTRAQAAQAQQAAVQAQAQAIAQAQAQAESQSHSHPHSQSRNVQIDHQRSTHPTRLATAQHPQHQQHEPPQHQPQPQPQQSQMQPTSSADARQQQYRSPQGAPVRNLVSQRSFPGPPSTPSSMSNMQFNSSSPARQRRTMISGRTASGLSGALGQIDSSNGNGPTYGPSSSMSYAGDSTTQLFAGMDLSTSSAPLTPHGQAPPSHGSSSTVSASSTPWQDGSGDYSMSSSATSFVITEPGTTDPSPSRMPGQFAGHLVNSTQDRDAALTETHLNNLGNHQMFSQNVGSFSYHSLSPDMTSGRARFGPPSHHHRVHHAPQPSTSSLASTTSSTPMSHSTSMASLASLSESRSLPAKHLTNDAALAKAYVQFCLYCNPEIAIKPLPVGIDELAKLFLAVPKSGEKRFSPLEMFKHLQKLGGKETKTWVRLAQDMGVEASESPQRFNQYGVRLKKWMKSLHVDAFFDYLMNKPNPYYDNPQGLVPPAEGEGVEVNVDLVVKTLLEGSARRGRKKTTTDGGSSSRVESISTSLIPQKRGRVTGSRLRSTGSLSDDDMDWDRDVDGPHGSESLSTSMWVDNSARFGGISPPLSAPPTGRMPDASQVFPTFSSGFVSSASRPQTASGMSAGERIDVDVVGEPVLNSSIHGLLPSAQLVASNRYSGPIAKRPRLRTEGDLDRLVNEDDILRQALANAGVADADIVRCLALIAARNLLPSTFGSNIGARPQMVAPCKVTDVEVRRNADVEPELGRRMSTRSTRTTASATGSTASKKGSSSTLGGSSATDGKRVGTAYVISWSFQRGAMKASLEVELGDGEQAPNEWARDEDEKRVHDLESAVRGVRNILAHHGLL